MSASLLLMALGTTALAQEEDWCGTPPSEAQIEVPIGYKPAEPSALSPIPVVFHVIRDDYGNGDIPDAMIEAQVAALNQEFSGVGIAFYLLGVSRLQDQYWHEALADRYPKAAKYLRVDPFRVMNVWVGHGRFAGAAYVPGPNGSVVGGLRDGLFINWRNFPGSVATGQNSGDVGVHEAGHYFGLDHTWKSVDPSQSCDPDNDDGFADTGLHDAPNLGCPRPGDPIPNSCVDPGPIDLPDPIFNFMNYTSESCQEEFTQEQGDRKDFVWRQLRSTLGEDVPTVYDARSAPVSFHNPTFSGEHVYVLPGADVALTGTVTLLNGAQLVIAGGADFGGITGLDLQGGSVFDARGYEAAALALSGDVSVSGGSALRIGARPAEEFFRSTDSSTGTYASPATSSLSVAGDVTVTGANSTLDVSGGAFSLGASGVARFASGGRLVTQGGMALGPHARLLFEPDAAPPEIIAGYTDPTFALDYEARIVFRNGGYTLSGLSGEPISVRRLDPAKAWSSVVLEGDGITLEHVVLDGGTKNVEVAAKNVTLRHLTSRNGWRGLSSYYAASGGRSSFTLEHALIEGNTSVGLVLYNANATISTTTVRANAQAGLWTVNGTSSIRSSEVSGNGTVSSSRDGIEVHTGGELYMDYGAGNVVQNNGEHEVYVTGSGRVHAYKGSNGICDASDPGVTGKYVYNASSYSVNAMLNWWGTTSPSSSLFYGPVSFSPWSSTGNCGGTAYFASASPEAAGDERSGEGLPALAGAATRSVADLEAGRDWAAWREWLVEAREALTAGAATPEGPRLAAELYVLQRMDPEDLNGEAANTQGLLQGFREALLRTPALAGTPMGATAERAALIALDEALLGDRYDEARALLAAYAPHLQSEAAHAEIAAVRIALFEEAGDYTAALAALEGAEHILDASFVSVVREELEYRLSSGEAGQGRAQGVAPIPIAARGAESSSPEEYALGATYPNPLSQTATVPMPLPETAAVRVAVYDVLGREVSVVAEERLEAGRHTFAFDG